MEKTKVHNLIIVDASGSMRDIHMATLIGINNTLHTVKSENKYTSQTVTLLSFANGGMPLRYIFRNINAAKVRAVTKRDYEPFGYTALYDAVGESLTKLRPKVAETDKVLVTVISDGLDNDSQKWTMESLKSLIEELGGNGWVFTYIGANQDTKREAAKIGIQNYLTFRATDHDTEEMFERENRCRRIWFSCLRNGEKDIERNYFGEEEEEEEERITPQMIKRLAPNEVFVFGSNIHGKHRGGAARTAREEFGALYGVPEGMQGQCYAIPTVGCSYREVAWAVERFTEYAREHRNLHFLVTPIGCGHAGYSAREMAGLFKDAAEVENISLPEEFWRYLH